MEWNIDIKNSFEPFWPVEIAAGEVIRTIRDRLKIALDSRVDFHTYKSKVEPLIGDELEKQPKYLQGPLWEYLKHLVLAPLDKDRSKYRNILSVMSAKEWESKDIAIMELRASFIFEEILDRLKKERYVWYTQAKEALWNEYLNANLQIFGTHAIYNIAIDAIEKSSKRHLPRKTELAPRVKKSKVKKWEEALAN
jgi:hypothetical protein